MWVFETHGAARGHRAIITSTSIYRLLGFGYTCGMAINAIWLRAYEGEVCHVHYAFAFVLEVSPHSIRTHTRVENHCKHIRVSTRFRTITRFRLGMHVPGCRCLRHASTGRPLICAAKQPDNFDCPSARQQGLEKCAETTQCARPASPRRDAAAQGYSGGAMGARAMRHERHVVQGHTT